MIRVAKLRCAHGLTLMALAFVDRDGAADLRKAEEALDRMMATIFETMRSGELGKMCPACYAAVRDDVEAGQAGALALKGTIEDTAYATVAEASRGLGGTDITQRMRQAERARWN